jgi:NADH-quinone oxidoreductase subunit K
MHPVIPYVIAALLFGVGSYGVLARRNAVLLLMAVELMLNAVNLIFVTADATVRTALPRSGQVFALFVIVLAAAEVGVGLAIVLQVYRLRFAATVDDIPLSDPAPDADGDPAPALAADGDPAPALAADGDPAPALAAGGTPAPDAGGDRARTAPAAEGDQSPPAADDGAQPRQAVTG